MAALHKAFRLLMVFCAAMVVCSARAQEAAPPKVAPEYAELFEAGRLLKSNPALDAATQSNATLFQKRMALSDKSVVRAFDLLHAWLEKGGVPFPIGADAGGSDLMPALSGIRALGRALAVKEYVALADGRVHEAIDIARDGLRLSYGIQNVNLLAWLTGGALQAILLKPLSARLDQLSVRDSEHLSRLAQDWMASPDPLPMALEGERQGALAGVSRAFADRGRDGIRKLILDSEEGEEGQRLTAQMDRLPLPLLKEMLAQMEAQTNAVYHRAQLAARTPYWELTPAGLNLEENGTGLAAQLAQRVAPILSIILDRHTRQQATMRLLGCHAAILRYRWEHNRLPASLAELKLGDMAIDPFNGQPFVYKTERAGYTLESIGPVARDENNKPASGQRVPVTLTFGGR